ncbi:hypothetical protein [Chitinophaga sp. YIM B06452]|uniref:hypothetical protein n=1 Tax=Chitinophaga sp. YIM B06452 TaxID=3082158 RepID=UPI0031FE5918
MTYCYTKIWKTAILLFFLGLAVIPATAQMKFGGTSDYRADAILELSSTKKGFLLPRINATALAAPPLDTAAPGMMIYNQTDNSIYIRKKTGPSTSAWVALQEVSGAGATWSFTGNNNINPAINYLGSSNAQPLIFKTNNTEAARIAANGRIGIGTAAPTTLLHVNGSTGTNVATAAGNFAMADSNSVIIMNNTSQATLTLQTAAGQAGRAIEIISYGADSVFFAGANVRSQATGTNPVGYVAPGYSVRLVSNGTDWVVSGKQRSGVPLYIATTAGARDGEVVRNYNSYLNNGSAIIQTDVLGAPLNPIPNEGAWFSMMMQAVGSRYFGQFNLNDHNAYFRGGEKADVATSTWYKFLSIPASEQFAASKNNDTIQFNHAGNKSISFYTNDANRMTITGNGLMKINSGITMAVTIVTDDYVVKPEDYTLVFTNLTGTGTITVTLPDASTNIGRVLVFKKLFTANRDIDLDVTGSDQIDFDGINTTYRIGTGFGENNISVITLQAVSANQWIILSQY